jgi:low affinity Fe/Cu permease
MHRPILVGAAAGIAASLLLLSQSSGGLLALIAPLLAPLPVAIAGLGWGVRAIISALITSVILIAGLFSSVVFAVGFVAVLLLPIAWMAYGFGLERYKNENESDWFPASWNMTIAIGITAVVFTLVNILQGPTEEATVEMVRNMIMTLEAQGNQPIIVSEEQIAAVASMFGKLMIGVPPASWFLINVGTLAAAAAIVRRTGKLRRPKQGLLMFQMPRWFGLIFLGGLAVSISSSGALFKLALVMTGLAGAAMFLVGIAVIHFKLKNSQFKTPLLTLLYVSVFIIGLPALFCVAVGLLDGIVNFRKLEEDQNPLR